MGNYTFAIFKPDTLEKNNTGAILSIICKNNFKIRAIKILKLSSEKVYEFYEIHKEKYFFNDLLIYMSRGPILVCVLEKMNAVEDFRNLIGVTDPQKAEQGTIRNLFATHISENAVHGSDSFENAQREKAFFFSDLEIY